MSAGDSRFSVFPRSFIAAAEALWGGQASSRLAGALTSIDKISKPSEVAAIRWLSHNFGARPFLSEKGGLESLVYPKALPAGGKKVDLVARSLPAADCNSLILLEAKSDMNSAAMRDCPEKFETTIKALMAFYKAAGQPEPQIQRLVVTGRAVNLSGSSGQTVQHGNLCRDGNPVIIADYRIHVETVPF